MCKKHPQNDLFLAELAKLYLINEQVDKAEKFAEAINNKNSSNYSYTLTDMDKVKNVTRSEAINWVLSDMLPSKIDEIIQYWATSTNLYNFLVNEAIEEYFKKGINLISKQNRTITVLNKYSKEFSTNKITFYVASENDKLIVLDAMKLIKPFLIDFGFEHLLTDIVISKNEIDYAELRNKEIKIHDQQADVRSYEQQVKAVETRKFEREKKQNTPETLKVPGFSMVRPMRFERTTFRVGV